MTEFGILTGDPSLKISQIAYIHVMLKHIIIIINSEQENLLLL